MSTLLQDTEAGTLILDTSDPGLPRFAVSVNQIAFGVRRVRSIRPGFLLIEQERVLGSLPPDVEPDFQQFDGQSVYVDIETVDANDNPSGQMTLAGIARVTTMEDLERLVLVIQMQVGPAEDC